MLLTAGYIPKGRTNRVSNYGLTTVREVKYSMVEEQKAVIPTIEERLVTYQGR